jgi:hypothetical protein
VPAWTLCEPKKVPHRREAFFANPAPSPMERSPQSSSRVRKPERSRAPAAIIVAGASIVAVAARGAVAPAGTSHATLRVSLALIIARARKRYASSWSLLVTTIYPPGPRSAGEVAATPFERLASRKACPEHSRRAAKPQSRGRGSPSPLRGFGASPEPNLPALRCAKASSRYRTPSRKSRRRQPQARRRPGAASRPSG